MPLTQPTPPSPPFTLAGPVVILSAPAEALVTSAASVLVTGTVSDPRCPDRERSGHPAFGNLGLRIVSYLPATPRPR